MKKRILILCTGNSCRSQMAQAIINAERGDQWEAHSGGTQPADRPNPYALRALAEIGIITEGQRPTHLSAYIGQPFDLVVTVCDDAADNCPVWMGQGQRVHIGFPDPALAIGDEESVMAVYRSVRDAIHVKLLALVDEA
ncbi:MAG: arsenate reductase ArsC [Anaerolineae bacterium]